MRCAWKDRNDVRATLPAISAPTFGVQDFKSCVRGGAQHGMGTIKLNNGGVNVGKKTEKTAPPLAPKAKAKRNVGSRTSSPPGGHGPAPGTPIPRITDEQWAINLRELALHANRVKAVVAAGISLQADYNRRKNDPEYAALNAEAIKCGIEALEAEAHRRAHQGVTEPIYQGGVLVGTKQVYSNSLLTFLLSANCPEKYRQRTENINMNMNLDLAGRLERARKRNDKAGDE